MDFLIYGAVAALAVWSVWYVVRHIVRQLRGKDCEGDCSACPCGCGSCKKRK